MPLTDTHIRNLKPDMKPRKYFDGGGLFLFIPTSGSKLWRMAYRFDGKSKCELSRNLRISVTQLENGARRFFVPGTVIA